MDNVTCQEDLRKHRIPTKDEVSEFRKEFYKKLKTEKIDEVIEWFLYKYHHDFFYEKKIYFEDEFLYLKDILQKTQATQIGNYFYALQELMKINILYKNFNEALALYVEATTCLEQYIKIDINGFIAKKLAFLYCDGASIYYNLSEFNKAIELLQKSLLISKKWFSAKDTFVLKTLEQLQSVYLTIGKNTEAELYDKKIRSLRKKIYYSGVVTELYHLGERVVVKCE